MKRILLLLQILESLCDLPHTTHFHNPYAVELPVQCNPYTAVPQICPNDDQCDPSILQCLRNQYGTILYCICGSRRSQPPLFDNSMAPSEVHCNPSTIPAQLCPNNQICSPSQLECSGSHGDYEYCICPAFIMTSEMESQDDTSSTVFCYPEAGKQHLCPSGDICNPSKLECMVEDHHHIDYCICPHPPANSEVHCNPQSDPVQICPSGQVCSPFVLHCVDDYCLCDSRVQISLTDYYNAKDIESHHHIESHHSYDISSMEVHCDPNSLLGQICPNGEICDPNRLECVNDHDYCICGLYSDTVHHIQENLMHPVQENPVHVQENPVHHIRENPVRVQVPAHHIHENPVRVQVPVPVHHIHENPVRVQVPVNVQENPVHHIHKNPVRVQVPVNVQESPVHHIHKNPVHHVHETTVHHIQENPVHHVPETTVHHHIPENPVHVQESLVHIHKNPVHRVHETTVHRLHENPIHIHTTPVHVQENSVHVEESPIHVQENSVYIQENPVHIHKSPVHNHKSPVHLIQENAVVHQENPVHHQENPVHVHENHPVHVYENHPVHVHENLVPHVQENHLVHHLGHLTATEDTHCNPNSEIPQICPDGTPCNQYLLTCVEDFCICGSNSQTVDTHCDPNAQPQQICPNGAACDLRILQCTGDYCVCSTEPILCDPNTQPPQVCPNGQRCDRHHLICEANFCVCEDHFDHHGVDHHGVAIVAIEEYREKETEEVHCNPHSEHLQICPNGRPCDEHVLVCKEDYCICPIEEIHCNPYSDPPQVCPDNQTCNKDFLFCMHDYCVCGSSHLYPHHAHEYGSYDLDHHPHESDTNHIEYAHLYHEQLPSPDLDHQLNVHHRQPFPSKVLYSRPIVQVETHCFPRHEMVKICPDGTLCDPSILHCKIDNHTQTKFCICGTHKNQPLRFTYSNVHESSKPFINTYHEDFLHYQPHPSRIRNEKYVIGNDAYRPHRNVRLSYVMPNVGHFSSLHSSSHPMSILPAQQLVPDYHMSTFYRTPDTQ